MREHWKYILTAAVSAVFVMSAGLYAFAAEAFRSAAVDTVVLNTDLVGDEEILSDLSWKTKNDQGQWINELKIAEDVDSLILVMNNLDKEDPHALPKQKAEEKTTSGNAKRKVKKEDISENSRLYYFSRHGESEWQELFSADCLISGDSANGKTAVYGVYHPDLSFGLKENPGSLLSYRQLDDLDYWILDTEDERFGEICRAESRAEKIKGGVRLENHKTFCNYGMILKPETEDSGYPALVISCQQNGTPSEFFCGIQLPEKYVRMLIQSLDENTRIVITDELESLSEIG